MGQDMSAEEPWDPSIPPEVLTARNLRAVADYILSGRCRRIVFMVGAGISTSAGIPDFRSPDTGLYANLARLNLERPEDVFDIHFFRENPQPFYTLARELWPGKFAPTPTHVFMSLLADRGLLSAVFTQNIDTLELAAGVPRAKVVFAHGSFATQSCTECQAPYPRDKLEAAVAAATPARCEVPGCGGLVKPDIVFFGEALPPEFHTQLHLVPQADLAIIMGSSLQVQPFASLPVRCAEDCPRVLLNMEQVGAIGSRREDVVALGECDAKVRQLADYLGWRDELEERWELCRQAVSGKDGEKKEVNEDNLEEEVERLTKEVDSGLKVADEHKEWVQNGLEKEDAKRRKEVGEAGDAGGGGLGHVFPHIKKEEEEA